MDLEVSFLIGLKATLKIEINLSDINHVILSIKLSNVVYPRIYFARGGGGVLRFGLDGDVPLEPRNPYPCSGVILAEKGTHV